SSIVAMGDVADSALSSRALSVAHELLLLTLGQAPDRALDRALAGALLGELTLRGLVRLAPAALHLSPIALDALVTLRDSAPAHALVLEQLLATHEPFSPAEWVAMLALRSVELRAVLYEELREAGVLGPHPPGSRQPGEPARASLALADAT